MPMETRPSVKDRIERLAMRNVSFFAELNSLLLTVVLVLLKVVRRTAPNVVPRTGQQRMNGMQAA